MEANNGKIIEAHDALGIANDAITKIERDIREQFTENSLHYRVATKDGMPLKLPTGWRVPYDLLRDGVRIRDKPLILFVEDKQNPPAIESGYERLDNIKSVSYQEQPPPPLKEVETCLKTCLKKQQEIYPVRELRSVRKLRIETIEPVVASSDKGVIQPSWRIGFLVNDFYHCSAQVSLVDEKPQCSGLKLPRFAVQQSWNIGPNWLQADEDNITIQLGDLSKEKKDVVKGIETLLRSQWLILSCIAHASEYLAKLQYQRIKFYDIDIELLDTSDTQSPSAGRVGNIPVISFSLSGGWTEDPTIICHELGHAVWDFLFTYPPKCLDVNSEGYMGIQEGFADYFAATLLAKDKSHRISIGRDVPDKTIDTNYYGDVLPRLIDGNRPEIPDNLDAIEKRYGLGKRWANLLWDLREQIGSENADQIIFLAHFKPFTGECQPQDPMEAYFQSLKQAAERLKDAKLLEIDFTEWHQLEVRHQI